MKSTVSAWTLSCTLTLALGTVIACAKPAATPASSSSSESAQTRELEEKAAGYDDRFQDIQASDLSAEQKAQAVGELVDEQQRTIREAQDNPANEEPADPQQ